MVKYKVLKGDTLSSISKKYYGNANRYMDIARKNGITDVNSLSVGQELKIDEPNNKNNNTINNTNNTNNSYKLAKGDSLSKIAQNNGTTLNELLKYNPNIKNPNNVLIGQSINLPKERKYTPKVRTIQEIENLEKEYNNDTDENIINKWHERNNTNRPYIIDDKKNNKIGIYKNGKLIKSYQAIHGKNKESDDMTITHTDNKGKIINLAGNLSTPAGYYISNRTNDYHGAPAYMRQTKAMRDKKLNAGIPSSIHKRTIIENANTNGCTGVCGADLKDMANILGNAKDIETYILPSDKRNRFKIRNNSIQFKSHDVSKTPAYSTLKSNPIHNIRWSTKGLDEHQRQVVKQYATSLIKNKANIQKKLGINDDSYNKLAQNALGILGVESNYGQRNTAIGNFIRAARKAIFSNNSSPDIYSKFDTYGINDDNNSIGLTQIRYKYLSDDVKKLYKQYGITKKDLVHNPSKAAIATMIKLADEYKRVGSIDKTIKGYNNKNSYSNMVNNQSKRFIITQKYKMGGNDKLKPNVVRGGQAIPLKGKTNYYYMQGRKHKDGGIDIGENPRTGLEVEDGEVMHVSNNEIKVFSSVPFLNGKSPAQKVMGGENPTKVFNQQEEFKDRKGLNDDGTKKKRMGGQSPKRKYTTELTADEEKQFQNWYSKVAKYKNLNPNPDADGQDYDYRGYWKNEDRNGILGSNPNAHFTDKYKQSSHPTFSNESKYSSKETPGGEWVKGKGTWLFKHNKFTARQANRTADYLNGTGEGFILGTDTIIPNRRKRMGGLSRKQDYGSKSKPYPKVKAGDFAGSGRSYPIPTKADAVDALRLAGLHGRSDVKANIYNKYPELRKKAKVGGLYSVTIDGKTKLHRFPSTGEDTLDKRRKFIGGGSDVFDDYTPFKENVNVVSPWKTLAKKEEDYKPFDKEGKPVSLWEHLTKEQKDDDYKLSNSNNNTFEFVSPWEHLLKKEEADKKNTYETIPGVPWTRKPKTPEMLADEQYKKDNPNVPEMLLRPRDQVETKDDTKDDTKDNWWKRTFNKAKQYVKDNPDTISNAITDGAGLVSNIAGGFISHNMNKKMLNKLKYNSQPIARQAAKLKTNININPQLDKMRESLAAYERDIDTNTASSRVALARKQRARLANMLQTNDLFGNKENMETELINKDRLNQQSVADANIRDYNDWREKKAAFDNAVREKKAENDVSLINTINAGVQDIIGRGEKRKSERQTRLAMAAANPNVNPRILKDLGIKGISNDDIERWEKAFAKKKKKNNNNEN